jgi:hypothetical protein
MIVGRDLMSTFDLFSINNLPTRFSSDSSLDGDADCVDPCEYRSRYATPDMGLSPEQIEEYGRGRDSIHKMPEE